MNERFYVGSVTGYGSDHDPITVIDSGGSRLDRKPPVLWYAFDSVPPRPSKFMGAGELGERKAVAYAQRLNAGDWDFVDGDDE